MLRRLSTTGESGTEHTASKPFVCDQSHKRRYKHTDGLTGFAFVLPSLTGLALFTFLPVLASLALSFTEWDMLTAPRFTGLQNYRILLVRDAEFWRYWSNTLILMAGIPLAMVGSLALAVLLNGRIKGLSFFRAVYFLPTMCSGIAVYILWRWMLNPQYGIVNAWLAHLGVNGPAWLQSTTWAKPALIIVSVWMTMGGTNMVLYLAALQNVPAELYEAASLDGAGDMRRFWHITWPLVSPTTFFILIMSVIGGFQGGFESAYVMTNGGPAGATTTISLYIYRLAFEWYRMGYAACVAWIMFVVVLAVTLVNWRYGGRLVHY